MLYIRQVGGITSELILNKNAPLPAAPKHLQHFTESTHGKSRLFSAGKKVNIAGGYWVQQKDLQVQIY